MLQLTESLKLLLLETANKLKGHERRRFMALTVQELGKGGQRLAERELGWNRDLIRKGTREVETGIICLDGFQARGRKAIETKLPNLLEDLKSIVDSQSQTDPSFKTNRLYTRLSVAQVRHQLIEEKGYLSEELPSNETLRNRINQLGYYPKKVAKVKPKKKIPETDGIFEQLALVNSESAQDPTILRLSLDAKATVKIGQFSRGGKNRVKTEAWDHDFSSKAKLTPYGILLPELEELFIYCTTSKVTSDFIVDILEIWWKSNRERFPAVQTLLLNQDNGPENHSRRTQFMKRMVEFAHKYQLNLRLAYYPPYRA